MLKICGPRGLESVFGEHVQNVLLKRLRLLAGSLELKKHTLTPVQQRAIGPAGFAGYLELVTADP